MSTTIITISSIEIALNEAMSNAMKRMMDLVGEDQMEPTIDRNGRLHAPCDNYVFDDRSYTAGQYLHDPDINGSSNKKTKIMVSISSLNEIKALLEKYGCEASSGKSWIKDNNEFCYLYIQGAARIINILNKMVPESGKTLVETKEGLETCKTWDTTCGKLFKKYFDSISCHPLFPIADDLCNKIYDWKLNKKKTIHLTIGFQYNTYYIG